MRKKYTTPHMIERDGVFYYVRHIPTDLRETYCVKRLCFSLKTRCRSSAVRASKSISTKLNDYWYGLRLNRMDIPTVCLANSRDELRKEAPTLSDALKMYLRLRGKSDDREFNRTAERNVEYVSKLLGDRPIDRYSSEDAAKFRDWLINRDMSTASIKRNFVAVRSIINLAISEKGLDCSNGFSKTFLPRGRPPNTRKPIPVYSINYLQKRCYEIDDESRWLLALISDTGMRLGEAVGLAKSDIFIRESIPFVKVRHHEWRGLKTKSSQRDIPLVGASLWASNRILACNNDSIYAFPKYNNSSKSNANSASSAINLWLKKQLIKPYQIHGLRHSMRDRLRAIECPSDVIDRIGGWTTAGIGHSYGEGYPLRVLYKWLKKIC